MKRNSHNFLQKLSKTEIPLYFANLNNYIEKINVPLTLPISVTDCTCNLPEYHKCQNTDMKSRCR